MLSIQPENVIYSIPECKYGIALEEKEGLYQPFLFHQGGKVISTIDQIRSKKWYLYDAAIVEGHRMLIRYLLQEYEKLEDKYREFGKYIP